MARGAVATARGAPNSAPHASPTAAEIERTGRTLDIAFPPSVAPSDAFRAIRTRLNLTQKEFGSLIASSAPISASVICQLENGSQTLPATLFHAAAHAASAVIRFGAWKASLASRHDSTSAALRALGAGCEAELGLYVAGKPGVPDEETQLVGAYLSIVSRRKQSSACDRPATRGPYKKTPKDAAKPRVKRLPKAAALSSGDGDTTPSTSRSSASEQSRASTRPGSPTCDGIEALSLWPDSPLPSWPASPSGFLDRLEAAERRDQETLRAMSERGVSFLPPTPRRASAVSPVDPIGGERTPREGDNTPRGGEDRKRQNTRDAGDGDLMRDMLLSVVDLDQLNVDELNLDELLEPASQGVDEIVDLVCGDLASASLPDFDELEDFAC
ncbi:hypothetical protein AB1Y20_007772 [Prymnesium parvum]|uniref:HTH cro/C1-type domain-containing protein n=1 Tax=Prymnesium parvum TaxID=97485 RepID=A0AB34IUH0_PRYPA